MSSQDYIIIVVVSYEQGRQVKAGKKDKVKTVSTKGSIPYL